MNPSKAGLIWSIKRRLPWWAKVIAKLILVRLPVDYRHWRAVGLFEHGRMEEPKYAFKTYRKHFGCFNDPSAQAPAVQKTDFVVLELGPGDSLCTMLIARAFGASFCYLVDVGDFATEDLSRYQAMAAYLEKQGFSGLDFREISSIQELVVACNSSYLYEGVTSLRALADESVDFVFSNVVLQHVLKRDFLDTMCELRRILRKGGCCSHRVDLKDHLGGALNNLRFSERLWESEFMACSGFYTNRIRYSEMLQLFEQAGFTIEIRDVRRWSKLPTPRRNLAKAFRALPEDELLVTGFDVVLRPI